MTVPPTLSPELRRRIGRQRMVMGGLVAAAALAVVLGGFAVTSAVGRPTSHHDWTPYRATARKAGDREAVRG